MGLSINQTVVTCAAIAALCALVITGHLDGGAATAVLSALAGNALGYVNGKKLGLSSRDPVPVNVQNTAVPVQVTAVPPAAATAAPTSSGGAS